MKNITHSDHDVIADVTAADQYITAAEALKLRGGKYPTPPAFYRAIQKGLIRKKPDSAEHDKFMVSRTDALEYFRTCKKPGKPNTKKAAAKPGKKAVAKPGTKASRKADPSTSPQSAPPPTGPTPEPPAAALPDPTGVAGEVVVKQRRPTSKAVMAEAVTPEPIMAEPVTSETVTVEVVADTPDSVPDDVAQEIDNARDALAGLSEMSDDDRLAGIKSYGVRARDIAGQAVNTGSRALVCAWACGTMLNVVKSRTGHGAFGRWLDEHLAPIGICTRTAQRYMKLANRGGDVRALLESASSLRQGYVACGILPEPVRQTGDVKETDNDTNPDTNPDKNPSPQTRALLKGLSKQQSVMRQLIQSNESLSESEFTQLELCMGQLNQFFNQLAANHSK